MSSYKVVVGTLWVNGKKCVRGQVIDLDNATEYGTRVEPHVEPKPKVVKKKPGPKPKLKVTNNESE